MNDGINNMQDASFQILTNRNAIIDILHVGYLDACEAQNEGLTERTIAAVSGEMCDLLGARYKLPFQAVPKVIGYIASVLSAYRIVQAITSLVSSEATSDNEWIPLQGQWKACNKLLAEIVEGKVKLQFPEHEVVLSDREDASFHVIAPAKTFDLSMF